MAHPLTVLCRLSDLGFEDDDVAGWIRNHLLPVEDLLAENVRVPAVLGELAQHVELRCSSRNASNWAFSGSATTWSAKLGG